MYTMPDACFVGSNTLSVSGTDPPARFYPEQPLLQHEVDQLNKELGTSCQAGTSWWLTTTPPQLPSLADYLQQYAANKTKFSEARKETHLRRRTRSVANPSNRLRQRLHELTQRLAPGAEWTTTGVVGRRGRVQLTDDPYPSPLFSRQPNGKRFKHYRAFYDEIARQANSNAHSRGATSKSTSSQRNPIQSYSLRIRSEPSPQGRSSSVRLKSRDGEPLRRRISRNRLRSRQYSAENVGRNRLSANDKRNANSENYEISETEPYPVPSSEVREDSFSSVTQNHMGRSQEYGGGSEFVDQQNTDTHENHNTPEDSLIFSQAHGSAGPHGSFQAESQGTGQAGEETHSAVNGGRHGASASSSAIRFDQQALAQVQVSPSSSGQSQPNEHSEESLNGTPTAVSASEIEDMMRRNGFTGFAMATVSSRKKERGQNKVKPLTSLGLSVPRYSDETDSGTIANNETITINGADPHEHDSVIIDHGGLVGGTGDHHHENEFQQLNQAEIPEGGVNSHYNSESLGSIASTQEIPGYPSENEYSDEYYDFERYNHNPPLYFPEDYSSFDDSQNIDSSHFHDTENSRYFPSEYQYQPDSVPSPSPEDISENVNSYSYEQRGATAEDENQNNFRYEEGIPYGQDIISYHETGALYNSNGVSPDTHQINTGGYDTSNVDHERNNFPYHQISDSSFDQYVTSDQGNQIDYNVKNQGDASPVTEENDDLPPSSQIPNRVNGGHEMMIIDNSLQSYFLQPPGIEVPSGEKIERFPDPNLILDYDVHSRRTDLTTPYNSYDQAGLLGSVPVIEHIVQPIPVNTDGSLDSASFDSYTSSEHFASGDGSFLLPAGEDNIQDQNVQEISSGDQFVNQGQYGTAIQGSTPEESHDRELSNIPLYYPPGYSDRQPASQGVDNTFSNYPSHYESHFTPTEEIPTDQQNIPYDNRRELEEAAPTVDDRGLEDYTYINESEALDYEPDDYTVEIPATYNTSHAVYSTTHHYGYQRGSSERGIGSISNTILSPAVPPSIASLTETPRISTGDPQPHSSIPYSQASSIPSSPETEQSESSRSHDMEMRVLTPGDIGSTQSLPAADPHLANVKVVMAEAPNTVEMNRRMGKILFSGDKIPGTTGYIIPPGFRGRLILGNIGVTSSSQAQMMPGMSSQNINSMQGMQMRVSSSSSAMSTGSGASLSSSSSSDASPQGLLSSSSSSASSPQGKQTNYNSNNQPVYSYQQTFNSRGNGGSANGRRPSNHQFNWQPSTQNQGMRSKSWSSWRTSSSWGNGNSQPGSLGSGQYFSQSALQPTSRDCGYWSMRCNMVYGPYNQNEICQPTHVILPCCC